MTDADLYTIGALRPRRRIMPAFIALLVGGVIAWLGWCAVLVVQALATAEKAKACAAAEMSFDGTTCSNPPIEVHIHGHDGPPNVPEKNPLLGPGGA